MLTEEICLQEDQLRLEKIDRLYDAGVADWISLPQLVVVGDQSSGKSSVLEGLTGIPFPRDSGLCTRFVTQIAFRRNPEESVSASIIRTGGTEHSNDKRSLKFTTRGISTLSSEEYLDIINTACEHMGVPKVVDNLAEGQESFSADVLKLEFNGPQLEHFSVLDVPGLFRRPIAGQTKVGDISLVRNIVKRYIENPRSIILAVIPANVDVATQEILQMAEEADPERERTLTVFTKPDLVDLGSENRVVDLINGKETAQKLGYCIVRNRSQQEIGTPLSERHSKEDKFFDLPPWNSINSERAGMRALHTRMKSLLIILTRREFRNVSLELAKRLRDCESSLVALGPAVDTEMKQRQKLLEFAVNFQNLASNAIDGHYVGHPVFGQNEKFRLATTIMRMNEQFSEAMEKYGHTREFKQKSPEKLKESQRKERAERALLKYDEFGEEDLNGLLDLFTYDMKILDEPINEWIAQEYDKTRGFEIGTYSPQLLRYLFTGQSNNWEVLARRHIKRVIHETHYFIYHLLEQVCRNHDVTTKVFGFLNKNLLESYKKAVSQAFMLLEVERHGTLLTLNHYFADNVAKARAERIKTKFQSFDAWTTPDSEEPLLSLTEVTKTLGKNNAEHQRDEIHDNLRAYYKVARKRFVDAICLQAIDHLLIGNKEGPLKLFNPLLVHQASAEDVRGMVGESTVILRKRQELETQVLSLKKGRDILSRSSI